MDEVAVSITSVGILVFLAHLFTGIFRQTKLPDVLLLIIIGLVIGPGLGLVTPEHFGAVGPIFTTVTLIVLLFEEGSGIPLPTLRKAVLGTSSLSLMSFLVTMFAIAGVALYVTDLTPILALMLGAIVGSTSPAVVVPLVKQLDMQDKSRTILFLESAVSDVFSIVVALAFLELYRLGEIRVGLMARHILASFLMASTLGVGSGLLWSVLLNKIRTLHNAIFTTPAFVFVIFGVAEFFGFSGYIAALAFGITLGNVRSFQLSVWKRFLPQDTITLNETEKIFFSEVAFLLKTFFFVYVGLSERLTDPWVVSIGFLLTVVIFLIRIPVVRLSVARETRVSDASLMAAIAPKGLATVVLASIPLQQGLPDGELIQDLAYAVVLFSIVFTALLVFLLERTTLAKAYGRLFAGFGQKAASPDASAG